MGVFLAQDIGKDPVGRGDAGACINDEKADVGHFDRPFGQPPHPALQAVVGHILQPGAVDHGKAQIAKAGIAFAQVAGHAGRVVDQRKLSADQPVEQGRFADIRSADDGKRKAHGGNLFQEAAPLQGFSVNEKPEAAPTSRQRKECRRKPPAPRQPPP
jgi:hypothetical protein